MALVLKRATCQFWHDGTDWWFEATYVKESSVDAGATREGRTDRRKLTAQEVGDNPLFGAKAVDGSMLKTINDA